MDTIWKSLGAIFAMSLPVMGAFPVSFEDGENWQATVSPSASAPATVVAEHATQGSKALKVFYPGSKHDTWPSFQVNIKDGDTKDGKNCLCFTAWHEEKGNVALSFRVDYKNAPSSFGAETIPPRSKSLHFYPIAPKGSDGSLPIPTAVVVYRRIPRNDATLWFDNITLGKQNIDYKPIVYVPPAGYREPTKTETKLGAQLFHRSWMEHVFQNTLPLPSDPAEPVLSARACAGEMEPLTLSVHALKDFASAKMAVGELKGKSGVLPASCFKNYIVRCMDKRVTYQSLDFYQQIPAMLERIPETALTKGVTRTFWAEADVPADAKPGLYKGFATLTLDGQTIQIPVEFTVRGFTLPPAKDHYFGLYYTTPYIKENYADIGDKMRADLADMKKMGMTSIGLCYGPHIAKDTAKYENTTVKLNFSANDIFVQTMDAYRDLGFPMPIIILNDSGQSFCSICCPNLVLGTPEYKQAYQSFWKAMQAECKTRGWAELIVQPEDEPGWRDQDAKDRNALLLKYLKEIPGMRTEEDGPGDGYFTGVAGPYSDVWNYNGAVASDDFMKKLAAEGRQVAFYNCDVEFYRTATSRYMAGIFLERSGADGVFNWAYHSFGGSPYTDFDTKLGDHPCMYPAMGKEVGGPSFGWMGFREGVDDHRYIQLLKELIAKHPGKQADYAKSMLEGILGSLEYKTVVRNGAHFRDLPVSDKGEARITGHLLHNNGWQLNNYDSARELIAGQIEVLQSGKEASEKIAKAQFALTATERPKTEIQNAGRSVNIPKCLTTPKIDGNLDDECWKSAGVMRDFAINVGGKPKAQTTAYTVSDGIYLYLGVQCEEEFMNSLTANITENSAAIFNDDCVELFVDPTGRAKEYRQIGVNSLGFYYCISGNGPWSPAVVTGTQRQAKGWSMEMKVKMSDLGIRNASFGLNVCRERRPLEVFELSCWSPTGAVFATPGRFGTATLGMAWLREINASKVLVGEGALKVTMANPKANADQFVIGMSYRMGDKQQDEAKQTVSPGDKPVEVVFPMVLKQSGVIDVEVTVSTADGKLLERQGVQKLVPSPLSLTMESPFAGNNWQAALSIDYKALADEKLELTVTSNAGKEYRFRPDADYYRLTLKKGSFLPLDNLRLVLKNKKDGHVICDEKYTVFGK